MKEQLLATWATHNKMNFLLIDAITDAGMQKTVCSRGGGMFYLQWLHLHHIRMQWLRVCAPDIFKNTRCRIKKLQLAGELYLNLLKIHPKALKNY